MEGKKRVISVAVLTALLGSLTACDYDPNVSAQRDVYSRIEDCVTDWGDMALCQQMDETAKKELEEEKAKNNSSGGGGSFVYLGHPFYGPTYYGSQRVAYVGDREVAAKGFRAASTKSTFVRSSTIPSKISARAGLGATGRSMSRFSGMGA